MRTKLRFCLFALLALIGGLSVYAQTDVPVVKSLGEALQQEGNCDLVIDEGGTYQLQIIYYDSKWNEAILWDGTVGTKMEFGEYLTDGGVKKLIKSGTLHLGSNPMTGGKQLIAASPCMLELSADFVAPKEISNPADMKSYDFVKIKGTLSEDGTILAAENGSIELGGGYGFTPDMSQYGGKHGYFTGIKDPFYGLKLYPEMFFTDGNPSSDRIDTFAKLKAITSDGMVHFYIPQGTMIIHSKKQSWGSTDIYLWDGKDGLNINGSDVDKDFFKNGETTAEPGQLISGDFNAKLFSEGYYFYYDAKSYAGTSANITFGNKQTLAPLELKASELNAEIGSKKYDYAYVKIYGTFYPRSRFAGDDGVIMNIADETDKNLDFEKYAGQKGWITAIAKKDNWSNTFRLLVTQEDYFVSDGMADVTKIVWDATTDNVVDKDIPLADVTIKNMNLKANTYRAMALPFSLNEEKVKTVFGEGAKVYEFSNYDCSETNDSIFLKETKQISNGSKVIVKVMTDANDLVATGIEINKFSPFESTLYKKNWNNPTDKEIRYNAGYSPKAVADIQNGYRIKEDGTLEVLTDKINAFEVYMTIANPNAPVLIDNGKLLGTTEEPVDPNAIDTFEELKAINTSGMVPFIIPKGTRVLYAQMGNDIDSPYLYLWDGKDGVFITGADVKASIFKNGDVTIEPGQLVTGTLTCMFFGENNYFYYNKSYYPDSEDNLTFGAKGDLVPLELTGQEMADKIKTKQYLSSYVQLHGTFDGNKKFVTDDGISMTIDDIFRTGFKVDPYVNHKGTIKGISSVLTEEYRIYPLSAEAFTDEGMADAEEIVYDATKENVIDKDIPLANVTINNVAYKGNRYSTICLPFSLNKAGVVKIFGTGTQIFYTDTYRSMADADTVFFSKSSSAEIRAGGVYVIKPAKDVSTITAEKVSIQGSAPHESTFWKDETSVNEKNIRLVGFYSPVALDNIANSYLFNEDGKLIDAAHATANAFTCHVVSDKELKKFTAFIEKEMVTDGIETVTFDLEQEGRIYNINGMYVGDTFKDLPKGIYIRNGKKVVLN